MVELLRANTFPRALAPGVVLVLQKTQVKIFLIFFRAKEDREDAFHINI